MTARQAARLASALAIAFVLIYVANSAPQYLGPLESFVFPNRTLFVAISLTLVSTLWLWRSGYWRRTQSKKLVAALELVEAGFLLVALTALFGYGLTPFNLCVGGGGGYTCYPDLPGLLRGFLGLMSIVLAEELFFRAYLINELNQPLGVGSGAVVVSSLLYSIFHLPALQVEGFGTISLLGFSEILIGALSLSVCYWYTERNLAVVVLIHAYWDAVGALLFVPNVGQYGPILLLLGQLSLPVTVIVVTHRFWSRL